MKINNKKIIVSTLALAMGAALAGSVSGTVAWFQYSTRAQAAYIGTTAHCSEALEVQAVASGGSVDANAWTTDLSSSQIQAAVTGGTDLEPISSMEMTATGALPGSFYKNPIYQFTNKTTWKTAVAANYVQFDLYFRVKDVKDTEAYLAKNLYLTDLTITAKNGDNNLDLYKAVRVHFSDGTNNKLFGRDGTTATTIATDVYGNLDLNNNGRFDKGPGYEWDDRGADLVYGDSGKQQVANNASGTNVLAVDTDPYNITANQGLIGAIPASSGTYKITVTIWLEGWAKINADVAAVAGVDANTDGDYEDEGDTAPVNGVNGAMWDAASLVGKKFQVGMRFAVPAHGDAE